VSTLFGIVLSPWCAGVVSGGWRLGGFVGTPGCVSGARLKLFDPARVLPGVDQMAGGGFVGFVLGEGQFRVVQVECR